MKLLPYIAILLLFSSCYTQKKAERQIIKAQTHHPQSVASLCANMYPPLEFVKDSFIYLPGRELPPRIDTVTANCDSLIAAGVTVVRIPCPPCKQKAPDTVVKTNYTQVVNRAKESELAMKLDKSTKDNAVKDTQLKELKQEKWNLWICLIVLLAYTVFRMVARFIPALAWLRPFLI